jgi:hypothetical protein
MVHPALPTLGHCAQNVPNRKEQDATERHRTERPGHVLVAGQVVLASVAKRAVVESRVQSNCDYLF